MGLAAWDHHVVAPYCHRSVLVASLLESCFTLQPGVPFDHTWGLPIGWHASGNSHLAFLWPGHDGGRRQGHACQWPSCRGDREDEVTELLSRELSKPIKDRALVVSVLVSVVSHRLYLWSALIKLREWIRWTVTSSLLKAKEVVKSFTNVEPTCLPKWTLLQFESFVSCQLAIYM